MSAGKLKYRVDIQSPSSTQDAIGQPLSTWTLFASAWADVRWVSGIETIKAGAVSSTVKASVRIRAGLAVTPAMRVLVDSVAYQVQAVLPDSDRAFVNLVVESIA